MLEQADRDDEIRHGARPGGRGFVGMANEDEQMLQPSSERISPTAASEALGAMPPHPSQEAWSRRAADDRRLAAVPGGKKIMVQGSMVDENDVAGQWQRDSRKNKR